VKCSPPETLLPSFDVALTNLLNAYQHIGESERPTKLRRTAESLSSQNRQLLSEMCYVLLEDSATHSPKPFFVEPKVEPQLSWDSLLPLMVVDIESMDQKSLEDLSNTFHQWLQ